MLRLPHSDEEPPPPPAAAGSAGEAVGEEILSAAVDLPWDDYLGPGASERVREGSLGLVRHAYPATAARDIRVAGDSAGHLRGDGADRERLGAIALGVASSHHRPARMPHAPGEEPFAWWVAEERTLVWMPWRDTSVPPYGLELLDTEQADAVVVIAPDACWTVYRSGLPRRGARGGWAQLPERFRTAVAGRIPLDDAAQASVRWRREADTITVRWREQGRVRSVAIAVNRPHVRAGAPR